MRYDLAHAGKDEKIIEAAGRRGGEVPAAIRDAPQLSAWLWFFYEAFHRLSSCRQFGRDISPIPWTAVQQYAAVQGFGPDLADDLHFFIGALDAEYLRRANRPEP